jgi:hypothetical protein
MVTSRLVVPSRYSPLQRQVERRKGEQEGETERSSKKMERKK